MSIIIRTAGEIGENFRTMLQQEFQELCVKLASKNAGYTSSDLMEPHHPMVNYLHIMTVVVSNAGQILEFSDKTIAKSILYAAHPDFEIPAIGLSVFVDNLLLLESKNEYHTHPVIFALDHKGEIAFYGQNTFDRYEVFQKPTNWAASMYVNNRFTRMDRYRISTDDDAGLVVPPKNATPYIWNI